MTMDEHKVVLSTIPGVDHDTNNAGVHHFPRQPVVASVA